MSPATRERFLSPASALHDRPFLTLTALTLALLALAPAIFALLPRSLPFRPELWRRWRSWLVLAAAMWLPAFLGPGAVIAAVLILSLACHREYARATGLFRERALSAAIGLGIIALAFASLDHWHGLYTAVTTLSVGLITIIAILPDRPSGYIQRVGLAVLGFMLCGACLGYLGFLANDAQFRPILFWLILATQLNDVLAFTCGKTFGRRKLAPNTSPNKTLGGALGAFALTTLIAASLAGLPFHGSALDAWPHRLAMGAIIATLGQLGDLLLSSIKRDVGIKDMGNLLPGHGGVLDRFNSLLLVAPALFHYIAYFRGIGEGTPARLLTGR